MEGFHSFSSTQPNKPISAQNTPKYTSGQKVEDQSLPAHKSVVMELMAPYLSRGYNLYIDNCYSPPALT